MLLKNILLIKQKFNKKFGVLSSKKVLKNKLLNLLVLEVFRLLLSNLFYYIRSIFFKSKLDKNNENYKFLKKKNYCCYE